MKKLVLIGVILSILLNTNISFANSLDTTKLNNYYSSIYKKIEKQTGGNKDKILKTLSALNIKFDELLNKNNNSETLKYVKNLNKKQIIKISLLNKKTTQSIVNSPLSPAVISQPIAMPKNNQNGGDYMNGNIEKFLDSKGFTIFFVDGKNKLLVDDGKLYNGYYGEKYVYPGKGYEVKESDLINALKSNKSYLLKYAIYNKTNKKIYLSNYISSKMDAGFNELKDILGGYLEVTDKVKGDYSFFSVYSDGKKYYLFTTLKYANLNNNVFTFIDNKVNVYGEDINSYKLVKDNIKNTVYLAQINSYEVGDYDILQNITNRENFFYSVADSIYSIKYFKPEVLKKIYDTTKDLVKNATTNEEKIKLIYEYVLAHTEYDYTAFNNDAGINDISKVSIPSSYTGIGAFETGKSVCNGYVKLMINMLSFAGVSDAEKIDGQTTAIGNGSIITGNHTWLRIGDKYYDPTFDDQKDGVKRYYALTKSVMNADRVEGFNSKPYTPDQVFQNYLSVAGNNDGELIGGYKVMYNLGIKTKDDLTFDNLKAKLGTYTNWDDLQQGSRLYWIENDIPEYYLALIRELGGNFAKGRLSIRDGKKYLVFDGYSNY